MIQSDVLNVRWKFLVLLLDFLLCVHVATSSASSSTECGVEVMTPPCPTRLDDQDFYMDCYNQSITELRAEWFPCDLLTLNLDRNLLTVLTNTTFRFEDLVI